MSLTFPEDIRARLGLEDGQELSVVELADGIKLVKRDVQRDRQMELAREVLREQAGVLRELAKR